jgi:hypothetical protein
LNRILNTRKKLQTEGKKKAESRPGPSLFPQAQVVTSRGDGTITLEMLSAVRGEQHLTLWKASHYADVDDAQEHVIQ